MREAWSCRVGVETQRNYKYYCNREYIHSDYINAQLTKYRISMRELITSVWLNNAGHLSTTVEMSGSSPMISFCRCENVAVIRSSRSCKSICLFCISRSMDFTILLKTKPEVLQWCPCCFCWYIIVLHYELEQKISHQYNLNKLSQKIRKVLYSVTVCYNICCQTLSFQFPKH